MNNRTVLTEILKIENLKKYYIKKKILKCTNPLDIVIILNGNGVKPAINNIIIPERSPVSEANFSLNTFAFSAPKISKILTPISLKKA